MKQRIELTAKSLGWQLTSKQVFWIEMTVKWICVLMVFVLYSFGIGIVGERRGEKKAELKYQIKLQNYILEQEHIQAEREAALNASNNGFEEMIDQEANLLAKVLYGVKDNSSDDLRTYCWCVFNRVDNPAFANTLDEVISQPNQWMRYNENNDILAKLKQIAREELLVWHDRASRPCSSEYVYMDWTPNDIVLRNDFVAQRSTRYWRYN